tara:strand:- start:76 stop:495 length:420 start_codon:yes stop_codon:yes gene_type:complete
MTHKIVAKYIKNIKFEIPNAKTFFLLEKEISNYKINIEIKSKQVKEKIIEVDTSISLLPTKESFDQINTKIIYSSIIEVEQELNDKKKLEEIVLVEVPSAIYPELRLLFISLFEKCGFKKIKVEEKVDFETLYKKRSIQ